MRGLCPESIFNSRYILSLTEEGDILYRGQSTSSIIFEKNSQSWLWRDMKAEQSSAVRIVETCHELLLTQHFYYLFVIIEGV